MKIDEILNPSGDEILEHHGIKGQKWGVENGPPYPLNSKVSTGSKLKKASSGSGDVIKKKSSSKKVETTKKKKKKWNEMSDKEKETQLKKDYESEEKIYDKYLGNRTKSEKKIINEQNRKEAKENIKKESKSKDYNGQNSSKSDKKIVQDLKKKNKKWDEMNDKEKEALSRWEDEEEYYNSVLKYKKKYPVGSNPIYKK